MARPFATFITALITTLVNSAAIAAQPVVYGYRVVNAYPHDQDAFTQGLLIEDGILFESTGLNGASTIRQVDLETGQVLKRTPLESRYFGEGIAAWDGAIVALTWLAGEGFVFDQQTLRQSRAFTYAGQGWGLTRMGEELVMSDGTPTLRILDPSNFEVIRTVEVTYNGAPLSNLNELEWVEGEIFANIWRTDYIVRIDPASGVVAGVIDLRGILPTEDRIPGHTDVLNGIAYEAKSKRLFVTGKRWPKLYEIELIARKPPAASAQ